MAKDNSSRRLLRPGSVALGFLIAIHGLGIHSPMKRLHAQESSDDLRGAAAVIKQLQEAMPEQLETSDPWAEQLEDYKGARLDLPPDEAARAWISLYDEWSAADAPASAVDFEAFVNALPNPNAWTALAKQIEKREEPAEVAGRLKYFSLKLLCQVLQDDASVNETLADLRASFTEFAGESNVPDEPVEEALGPDVLEMAILDFDQQQDWQLGYISESIDQLEATLNPKAVITHFLRELKSETTTDEESMYGDDGLYVPNLLAHLNRRQASEILRDALRKPQPLSFEDDATRALARELALGMLDEIQVAHWELCLTTDSTKLFEAFSKLPSDDDYYDYDRAYAMGWYIQGLIKSGESEKIERFLDRAVARDEDDQAGFLYALSRQFSDLDSEPAQLDANFDFLMKLLQRRPDMPFWETVFQLALKLDEIGPLRDLLDQSLEQADLSQEARLAILRQRSQLLLAAGATQLAAKDIRELLVKLDGEDDTYERMRLAVQLANVGRLSDQMSWTQLGISIARDIAQSNAETSIDSLVEVLTELERYSDVEKLIAGELQQLLDGGDDANYYSNESPQSLLAELARTYHRAGKHSEVLVLLRDAPWWQAHYLQELVDQEMYEQGYSSTDLRGRLPVRTLGFVAATALQQEGKTAEAIQLCKYLLELQAGYDPAWELLLQLDEEFEAFAKQKFAADQFEERPLIWLAQYYLNRAEAELAEKTVRQALEIDPSDGEQGRGDRMRGYSVLADALEAQQKSPDDVQLCRSAIRAIRKAELADQYFLAGMLANARELYLESLTEFADAYCIQSRLAVHSYQLGDLEAARKHYQRAFELMPSSFGRVESHCFGCEGVFKGELAEEIASKIFRNLLVEFPDNPKVHYLQGYLEQSRGNFDAAIPHYQQATKLDPEYLNAWNKLQELAEHLPPQAANDAVLALLKLDPLGRHSAPNVDHVTDLKALWSYTSRATPQPKFENHLLKLTASANLMQVGGTNDPFGGAVYGYDYFNSSAQRAQLANHALLQSIIRLHDLAD